jgi:hypothetical protein
LSKSLVGFNELVGWVDQLATIHAKLGSSPGRRHNQEALYRAGVVMTVAAWESFVEDLLNESFLALSPGAGAAIGAMSTWRLASAAAMAATKKFNTPNAKNVAELFQEHLDVDVASTWAVSTLTSSYTVEAARTRVNSWLDIRHKIAHGGALPANLAWIQSPSGKPRLTLALMNDARQFFHGLARSMDVCVASELVSRYGLPASPW